MHEVATESGSQERIDLSEFSRLRPSRNIIGTLVEGIQDLRLGKLFMPTQRQGWRNDDFGLGVKKSLLNVYTHVSNGPCRSVEPEDCRPPVVARLAGSVCPVLGLSLPGGKCD